MMPLQGRGGVLFLVQGQDEPRQEGLPRETQGIAHGLATTF